MNSLQTINTIIDSMPDLVFWKDCNGIFQGCNQIFALRCFGLSSKEVIGKTNFDLFADQEQAMELHQEDLAVIHSAQKQRNEIWFRLADGSRRCFDIQRLPLFRKSGEVYGMLLVSRDITDLKQLHDSLLASETRYRNLFRNIAEGFSLHEIICDQNGAPCDYRFLEINNAFEQLTGLHRDAIIGKRLLEIIPDEDPYWIDLFGRVALTGKTERFNHYSQALGRYYAGHVYSPAPRQFAVLFVETTELVVAEQELKAEKDRFYRAQRIAQLGCWEYEFSTRTVHWSDEMYRIFEADTSLVSVSPDTFYEHVHPEDLENVKNAFRHSLKNHTAFSITHRLQFPDGRIKYVHAQCETGFDPAGKPLRSTGTVQDITEIKTLQDTLTKIIEVEQEQHDFHNIVTRNPVMKTVLELASQVAGAKQTTVAIYGESGTGKEVLARAIHVASGGLPANFVAVNCSAIPEQLLESELFGHERGAFTGAERSREGKISAARGGTLLLDEIGDMPLSLQVKLLRLLETRTFEKVGSNTPIQLHCRVIIATNRDLSRLILEGRFREDLFHRINIFPLYLPPLRERSEDIPLLCTYLLTSLQAQVGRPLHGISRRALDKLLAYDWPGNIRELRNCLERAVILCGNGPICPEHLALGVTNIPPTTPASLQDDLLSITLTLPKHEFSLDNLTRQIIETTLKQCNGNKSKAAKQLKISRTTYYRS